MQATETTYSIYSPVVKRIARKLHVTNKNTELLLYRDLSGAWQIGRLNCPSECRIAPRDYACFTTEGWSVNQYDVRIADLLNVLES